MNLNENAMELLQSTLDILCPPRCVVCKQWLNEGVLCATCIRSFSPRSAPFCPRCGAISAGVHTLCKQCDEGDTPPYAMATAPFCFDGKIRKCIHMLKYDRRTGLAKPLSQLMLQHLAQTPNLFPVPGNFDMVMPVPMHGNRRRKRGFNQAELLAKPVADAYGIPMECRLLTRIRHTSTQTILGRSARASNLQSAFALADEDRIANRSILIVDDVLTTTATTREIARNIQNAGAKYIAVLALAWRI